MKLVLTRSQNQILQEAVPNMKYWHVDFQKRNTSVVVTYDLIHNLWQGSTKKLPFGEVEYVSDEGFGTEAECLLALSRKLRCEIALQQ